MLLYSIKIFYVSCLFLISDNILIVVITKAGIPIWDILSTGVTVLFQNNHLKIKLEKKNKRISQQRWGKARLTVGKI